MYMYNQLALCEYKSIHPMIPFIIKLYHYLNRLTWNG